MKKLILLLALPLLLVGQELRRTNEIYLAWDEYLIEGTTNLNWSFNLYRSPVMPATNWFYFTNFPYTSITNWDTFKVWVPNDWPRAFWVVTASNVTGESSFSDPLLVLHPVAGTNLSIGISSQ